MCETKETIAKLFVAFAEALNDMDSSEFEQLLQGDAKLRLVEKPRGKRSKPTGGANSFVNEIAQRLNAAESREAAEILLASIKQPRRKDFLLLLAKACNVHVASKDSIAMIERQLIENVVGARLTSEAIQKVAF